MKTVRLEEPGRFVLTETPEPARPGPGEARVRVRRVGVCGTDLHAFRGRQPFFQYPRILGHELGVMVEEVGPDVVGLAPGDRCAVEPYLNCGRCVACRRGKTNCCAELKVLGVHIDGGLREWLIVPANKLHKSSKLTLDQLALAETLGIGAHAVDRARLAPGETALVVGAGPIGLSVIPFAQVAGARVIVMDVNADRLDFCRRQAGVSEVVDGSTDPTAALRELTSGEMPTTVFDATGNPQSMARSFHLVAPGGTLVYVGLFQGDVTFPDPDFHRRELSLLATRNATGADFTRIIQRIESGQIDTTPWITHRATLDEMIEPFPSWLQPENRVIKAMISVGGE